MNKTIESGARFWLVMIAFTGVGSTLLGPYLPSLALTWHMPDRQAGLLVASLFLGSFTGNLFLSRVLGRTLVIGSWATFAGLMMLAWFVREPGGALGGLGSVALMGFGLGHIMGAINLIVGQSPAAKRPAALARVGAAWCIGAVFSPLLTSVLLTKISPTLRFAIFAPLFLVPVWWTRGRSLPVCHAALAEERLGNRSSPLSGTLLLFVVIFMLYSGVEASIGSWMPLFAARYGVGPVAAAQWIISLFWLGLIAGRLGLAAFVTPARERLILRCSLACSAGCLTLVLAFPTSFAVSLGSALMGVCLGPIFPLILAAAIEHRLQARSMGVVLGACGLGSAILPSFIGFISNLSTLRLALGVPVIALLVLLASQLRPRTEAHRSNVQWEQHPTRGQTPEML